MTRPRCGSRSDQTPQRQPRSTARDSMRKTYQLLRQAEVFWTHLTNATVGPRADHEGAGREKRGRYLRIAVRPASSPPRLMDYDCGAMREIRFSAAFTWPFVSGSIV
ncbi:hypothetical protein GCM10010439_51880 [Actinocorallia aurantiaca]|uniref:Uncharacterized protein n=1 Tax=Actinocorallia aurantiaca TaxID=46204 RepID=A0ABP6GZC2_9ACTN